MDEQPRTANDTATERAEAPEPEPMRRHDAERMCAALASRDARWMRRGAARSTGDT